MTYMPAAESCQACVTLASQSCHGDRLAPPALNGPNGPGFRSSLMHYSNVMIVWRVAPALVLSACNRRPESRDTAVSNKATHTADEAEKRQQERADDITRLDKRVAEIEREYEKANEKVVADKKTPAEGLKA